ncbi:MAG TPA: NAD-dependent epimerase/dehydratase family protein [Cellulomonas sp.]
MTDPAARRTTPSGRRSTPDAQGAVPPTRDGRRPVRVLVLGGYGAVGRHAVAELRARGQQVRTAGRDAARADVPLDLADTVAVARAAAAADVVLNAAGREDPDLVRTVTAAGAGFVDISASPRYLAAVERLDVATPVLLSVGLAPGLTNLLAHAAHRRGGGGTGPLDLAVVLGAGERHGPAATAWSLDLLGRRLPDTAHPGREVRNYTGGTGFDLPGGRRRLLRADFSDQHTLTRQLGRPVRTWFGLDTRLATLGLAALTWVPGARRTPPALLHLPGSADWVLQVRDADGPWATMTGTSQSRTTGVLAARAAELAVGAAPGVHHLSALTDLDALDLPFRTSWRAAHPVDAHR